MKRSTLVAAFVLLALGGYIYWFERGPIPDEDGEPIFDVQEDGIERIQIERGEEERLVLAKDDESWRLLTPVETEADAVEVDLLLQNLTTMELDRKVAQASEVELEDFGLEAPAITVRFQTADGTEHGVDFGAESPTGTHRYARRAGGEDVLVVASHLSNNFDKTAWDLREKDIFDVDGTLEARRIEVSRPEGGLVLESESGLWYVTEPVRARADRFAATGLVSRVREAEMQSIVSESAEDGKGHGLDDPAYRVRIELDDDAAEPLVLGVGEQTDGQYYASAPSRSELFLIEASLVDELGKQASELVSKKLFDYSTHQVNRFRVLERGDAERDFEKTDGEEEAIWRQTAPERREVDRSAVEDLLYQLNGTSADELALELATGPQGLDAPAYTITVWSNDGSREEEILVGEPVDNKVYVLRKGDEVALELSLESWREIEELLALEPDRD